MEWRKGCAARSKDFPTMELTVRQSDLLRELELYQGIVERKHTIPILGNVMLTATADRGLDLAGTDLDVGLRSRCDAYVEVDGAFTVPAKTFFDLVRALPDAEIRVTEGPRGSVRVVAEQFDGRIQTLARDDFPTMPELEDTSAGVNLPRGILREMLAMTRFATSAEDSRYYLNGAQLVLPPGRLIVVATDGHRLALASAERKGDDATGVDLRAILPRKTLWELGRLLADGDAESDVRYARGGNHLFFDIDQRQLISRTIDAQFPAYERVIPSNNNKRIQFERGRLISALKRVAVLGGDAASAVRFKLSANEMAIMSSSAELGEATEKVTVEYSGDPLEISFNAKYLLEFLGVASADEILLEFRDDASQAVMKPVETEGREYTYVIMPMRM